MPMPMAVLMAIILVILWSLGSWLLALCVMVGGLIWYGYRHIQEENGKTGEWTLQWWRLLGNLLGSASLLLIIFMGNGAGFEHPIIRVVFGVIAILLGAYAATMALYKVEPDGQGYNHFRGKAG